MNRIIFGQSVPTYDQELLGQCCVSLVLGFLHLFKGILLYCLHKYSEHFFLFFYFIFCMIFGDNPTIYQY